MSRSVQSSIAFDRGNQLVSIENEVAGDDSGPRINLLVMKFYEHGIANYYFYIPWAEFEASLPFLKEMVTSFSTENLDEALNREPVRVADLEEPGVGRYVIMFGGLFVILVVLVIIRVRTGTRRS